jgi:hypothetical protein
MKYNKVLFVVTEKHMFTNYSLLDELIKNRVDNYRIVYLPVSNHKTLFSRILFGKHILLLYIAKLQKFFVLLPAI